ncbi:hypothetical protein RJ640_021164 [Escallonia rubra]|uniref:GAG-pre-integrase domain-containing protein n=1 Tax=Escallonia rubra TaxID=112253 RepID=A0AA88RF98_9ASTE|nr:hypothetical protein RJ640_021164 [Escallonia rubra]
MAARGNSVNFSQSLIPIFKDENFEFWSIKMKTLFKSQDLWELVENGYADPDEENNNRLKENKKKDNKALLFIQQAVHETIFSRIAAATTSKEAWEILHKEFQGSSKVITVKLQSLRRDFETLFMRNNESVQDFLSRVTAIVSQMKSYGEQITDEIVVAKVLRSLTPTFDHVVAAIEESKDLSVYAFDELMGSLQAHEARLNRSLETKNEEKAFQVREESSNQRGRGHSRGGFRGRSRGRGRFFGSYHGVQCYKEKNETSLWHLRYGHLNINGLKLLSQNEMVLGLPKIESIDMYFLGLEVKQGKDGIFISQKKYATDLLKKFNMLNCKVAATPMNVNEKLKIEDGTQSTDGRFFRSLVGGLIYLTHTRPDIAFSVGVVSRFMHNPTAHHLGAAKRILRYIAGTRDFGLWYSQVSNFRLVGFSDSDWAGCLDDRRSTSGSIFNLGSGAITWTSKRQATVALSSSEAEYIAATSSACQAVWLRKLLADLLQDQKGATEIFCDNASAIAMTKNPVYHGRSKHIDIRHHFIRELVANEVISLKFCGTNEQVADILTKSLPREKHVYFRSRLGVCKFESRGSVEE